MNLRTTFSIDPSPYKITHSDRIMLIGSCFAGSMGEHMAAGKIPVMINPSGTVYNPSSVSATISNIISEREFTREDLYFHDSLWLSFSHYTDFSSPDPEKLLLKINNGLKEALSFLRGSSFLFITFGTARIYRLKETGMVVSNCHKVPAHRFTRELLTPAQIAKIWNNQLDILHSVFPDLRIIFTISPVRHLKDSPHGNQVSKSVLFIAIEEILKHPSGPMYFPAYELVMDDLRDYRFYDNDMIHPSQSAIEYIWEAFTGCYFSPDTVRLWNEVASITRAMKHRFNTENLTGRRLFAINMLKQIELVKKKLPDLDLSSERSYFKRVMAE
jgi:hypothetical protein